MEAGTCHSTTIQTTLFLHAEMMKTTITADPDRSIVEGILARCDQEPDRRCLIFLGEEQQVTALTCSELARRIVQSRDALERERIREGEVVLLVLNHGAELVSTFLGAIALGALPCIVPSLLPSLDPGAYRQRLAGIVERLRPVAMVVGDPAGGGEPVSVAGVRSIGVDTQRASGTAASTRWSGRGGREPAFVQLSSGSTGRQKAIPVSHRSIVNLAKARNQAFELESGDVFVGWVPLYHDLGIVGDVLVPLLSGVTSVIISTLQWLKRPVTLMEAVHNYRGTVCTMPNFAFTYCAKRIEDAEMKGIDLSHWRALCNGAEPIHPQSFSAFAERFARWGFKPGALMAGYGLAENTLSVSMSRLGEWPRTDWVDRADMQQRKVATPRAEEAGGIPVVSCGRPLANVSLEIRDDDGGALGDRRVGEVAVRSDCLFEGYFRDDAATREALRDGWLLTGDLGYTVAGELYVCGRKKDVIIVGGANVHAEDIEASAAKAGGVRPGRIVAFGVPDHTLGTESIVLLFEMAADSTHAPEAVIFEIRRRVKEDLDVAISDIECVPAGWIAKTTSGKIARWENRAKWLAEHG
jgi:acyl-CoA synthetase (AMP-forming)/AMP-acid ligase II